MDILQIIQTYAFYNAFSWSEWPYQNNWSNAIWSSNNNQEK